MAKMGRPTKYKKSFVAYIDTFLDKCAQDKELPTIEGICLDFRIDNDTLAEWVKIYPDFSDAIKRLKGKQSKILQSGITMGGVNPVGGIFLLKNNHGFKDRTETDITSAGKALPQPIVRLTNDVLRDNGDTQDPPVTE